MPADKVKLFPVAKRIFLEFGLKRIVDKKQPVSEEQMKSLISNFVNMLCVSNSYLICSRDSYLDIYRFNLRFTRNSDKIEIFFSSKSYKFWDIYNSVYLTYDSVRKLIKLLVPSHIGVSFGCAISITDTNLLERYFGLLNFTKDTNGKIGLKLDGLSDQSVQTLFERFTTRIHEVFFDIDRFRAIEFLEYPAFDQISIDPIRNSGEVSRVLRHRIQAKKLGLYSITRYFKIYDNSLADLKNETVKKLKLKFDYADYVKVEELVKQLHKSCMNLNHLDIEAEFSHGNRGSVNQVYDKVVAYVDRIEDLKARFGNSLTSMHIKFKIGIEFFDDRDNTWIKLVQESPEFKHWHFESYERDCNQYGYLDRLEMAFDNSECRLEMTIDVTTRDDEPEDEAFSDIDEDLSDSDEDLSDDE